MIRTKKLRGHKRLWKRIDRWKLNACKLDIEELKSRQREYTKVYVYPYFSIDVLNSITPIPKGKTRSIIIHALFEIYNSWEKELEKLGVPYYLKIWLFPENIGKSQVVCAIGDMIDWYDKTFHAPEVSDKKFDNSIFGDAINQAKKLTWEFAIDELSFDEEYLGDIDDWASDQEYYDSRRWLKRKMQKPHREIAYGEHTYYKFPQYTVWLGGT